MRPQSENVEGISHETLRDDAFYIYGVDVIRAGRKTPGKNQSSEVEVQPNVRETVTFTLLAGAVETGDGRSLSAAVSPRSLSEYVALMG